MTSSPDAFEGGTLTAVRRATAAMGTRFEVVIAHEDEARAACVADAALEAVRELHTLWSPFEKTSLMAFINRTAHVRPVRLDPRTFAMFKVARDVWRESGGAFDITVGPLMRAWGFRGDAACTPEECVVGLEHVALDEGAMTVAFDRPGIELDVGAIAKGAAVDQAFEVLREHGITSALVHGGTSSVRAIGRAPEAQGWRVQVGTGADAPSVLLVNAALSVSAPGGRIVRSNAGAVGHVLDPRTRKPAAALDLAAVVASDAISADAWSTALLVTGTLPEALPLGGITRQSGRWATCGGRCMPGLRWPEIPSPPPTVPARTLGRRLGQRIRGLMEGATVA